MEYKSHEPVPPQDVEVIREKFKKKKQEKEEWWLLY